MSKGQGISEFDFEFLFQEEPSYYYPLRRSKKSKVKKTHSNNMLKYGMAYNIKWVYSNSNLYNFTDVTILNGL